MHALAIDIHSLAPQMARQFLTVIPAYKRESRIDYPHQRQRLVELRLWRLGKAGPADRQLPELC